MFSPPYSPSLVNRGGGSIDMVKRLDASQLQSLRKSPATVASQSLTDAHAAQLRKSLNDNSFERIELTELQYHCRGSSTEEV